MGMVAIVQVHIELSLFLKQHQPICVNDPISPNMFFPDVSWVCFTVLHTLPDQIANQAGNRPPPPEKKNHHSDLSSKKKINIKQKRWHELNFKGL